MDMLVAETGISKTSMYKHFRTKDDLILAVLRLRDDPVIGAGAQCEAATDYSLVYDSEICIGDLEKPDQLAAAFAGVKQVLHLAHIRFAPTTLQAAGPAVEHVVMISSLRRFSRVPSPSVGEVIRGER